MQKKSNQLIHENSPYLLQHAYNPVEWYPWGDEALAKAKKENKMLIISVGYSACHWCHVMEHESYEDSQVASIMNEHFVNIKVDREERPDIDDIYMSACQLSNGKNCGWPLNAFALPDGRPVWAGTYFPKEQWISILKQFISYQEEDTERLEEAAVNLLKGMKQLDQLVANQVQAEINESLVNELHDILIKQIDPYKGGRKGAPKFPLPNNYQFLLQHYDIYHLPETLEAIETTLEHMAFGGIYDQIGGGFARYSTDADWFAPHFEKMLYDNAQLISLYSQAYQLTKNEEYKEVIDQSIEFVKRELNHPGGPFYSALDADSEGIEGKYYVWTASQIEQFIQNKDERQIIQDYFNITKRGNWEHGNNILFRNESKQAFAEKNNLSLAELQLILDKNKALLLEEREKRIKPGLDDKTLCSWNALMISGLVDAYKATGNKSYLELAKKNAAFIKNVMIKSDYSLWRSYKDGQTKINAFLDDYANTIQAFMGLYSVTFDIRWLTDAEGLTKYAIKHFYDDSNYSFYYTSDLDPALITRKMELSDNVIPGSVSTMTKNLLMLGHYLSNDEFLHLGKRCFGALLPTIEKVKQPSYYSNWLSVALHLLHSPKEIVIAGEKAEQLRDELMTSFLPNSIFVGSRDKSVLPLLENRFQQDKTLIYVCQNRVCKLPVDEVKDAKVHLGLSK